MDFVHFISSPYRVKQNGALVIKDIAISDKIFKVETFIKEGLQLDTGILLTEDDRVKVVKLMNEVEVLIRVLRI